MPSVPIQRIAGPAYLAASATNIYTPPSTPLYTVITEIRVVNKASVGSGPSTFSMYIGATGGSTGGTELYSNQGVSVGQPFAETFYPGIRMASTDFLSGLASSGSTLVVLVLGYYSVT